MAFGALFQRGRCRISVYCHGTTGVAQINTTFRANPPIPHIAAQIACYTICVEWSRRGSRPTYTELGVSAYCIASEGNMSELQRSNFDFSFLSFIRTVTLTSYIDACQYSQALRITGFLKCVRCNQCSHKCRFPS